MNDNKELKPCPIEAVKITTKGYEGWLNVIHKPTGYAIGMAHPSVADDVMLVLQAWNTRPSQPANVKEIEEALGKITQEPWLIESVVGMPVGISTKKGEHICRTPSNVSHNEHERVFYNFKFIAKSPEHIRTLLNELTRVSGERDRLKEALEKISNHWNEYDVDQVTANSYYEIAHKALNPPPKE